MSNLDYWIELFHMLASVSTSQVVSSIKSPLPPYIFDPGIVAT